jgi:hypothetical protein
VTSRNRLVLTSPDHVRRINTRQFTGANQCDFAWKRSLGWFDRCRLFAVRGSAVSPRAELPMVFDSAVDSTTRLGSRGWLRRNGESSAFDLDSPTWDLVRAVTRRRSGQSHVGPCPAIGASIESVVTPAQEPRDDSLVAEHAEIHDDLLVLANT